MRQGQTKECCSEARKEAKSRAAQLAGILLLGAAELAAQNRAFIPISAEGSILPPERRLVVSIPDRELAVVENGVVLKVYPVAVGRRVSPSPTGTFHVATLVTHPTYYRPGVVIPPGTNNPVGTRWIGLTKPGYGIHGTNEPASIGHWASHGCIRMRNRDVEDLFTRVRVGDPVELHPTADAVTLALFHRAEQLDASVVAAAYIREPVH